MTELPGACAPPEVRSLLAYTGVLNEAELATTEKGREAYEEAVRQLVRYVTWWKDRPKDVRKDRHRRPPTMPLPWGQRPVW